jgi:hypothetical protein
MGVEKWPMGKTVLSVAQIAVGIKALQSARQRDAFDANLYKQRAIITERHRKIAERYDVLTAVIEFLTELKNETS